MTSDPRHTYLTKKLHRMESSRCPRMKRGERRPFAVHCCPKHDAAVLLRQMLEEKR